MAKYTVTMSCGHEDTIELFGKSKDRERTIKYCESSGLCKECYIKKMNEDNKKMGLVFHASVLPYIDDEDGGILISVWFDGDTMTYKDAIKALGGYHWSSRESADDWYSVSKPPMCWNKTIKLESLNEEIEKAISIDAKSTITDAGLFAAVHYKLALDKQKEWKEKQEKLKGIEKPTVPEILRGCRWNQKIYGKSGNYSIYPDGEKVPISDEQAEEIKKYLTLKNEYLKKVEDIKHL